MVVVGSGIPPRSVTTLAHRLAAGGNLLAALDALCEVVLEATRVAAASVLMAGDAGQLTVPVATDARARALAEWQVRHLEGPSVEVCRSGRTVLMPRLEAGRRRRWPDYTERLAQWGLESLWSVPLSAGPHLLGALELLGDRPQLLDRASVDRARALAGLAAMVIVSRRERDQVARLADELQGALRSRVVIEQAKGRIAERHGLPLEDAFALLRHHARTNGLKLGEVAEDVAEGRLAL